MIRALAMLAVFGCHGAQRTGLDDAVTDIHSEHVKTRTGAMEMLAFNCCAADGPRPNDRARACPILRDAMEREQNALVLVGGSHFSNNCDEFISTTQLIRTVRLLEARADVPNESFSIFIELSHRKPDPAIEVLYLESLSDPAVNHGIRLLGDDELDRLAMHYRELPQTARGNLDLGFYMALEAGPVKAPALEALYDEMSHSSEQSVKEDGHIGLKHYRDRSQTSDAAVNAMTLEPDTLQILGVRRAFCDSAAAQAVLARAVTSDDPKLSGQAKRALAVRGARCHPR